MADKKEKKAEEKEEKKDAAEQPEEKEKKEGAEGEAEGTEGAEGEGGGKAARKKKLIIAAAGVVLLLVGGVGAAFLSGAFKGGDSEHADGAEAGEHGGSEGGEGGPAVPQISYLDMEEFLVNLNTGGKQNSFLKMKVTLELPSQAEKTVVEQQMPRVRDSFQIYLRELRANDLQGAGGMQRLREELLLRVNKIIYPAKVSDILFKEIIVQ